ncbi:MAG: FHA domain-containing protein [Chloroflexi bacterium]|nr:FHA domain-containing protein [Chloroflexota bacterium]
MVLHLVDTGDIIHVGNKKEFTIGRTGDGQKIIPEIDLTDYDAYSAGVSRLHVNLSIGSSKVTAQDLDSANGTRLNGIRLTPQTKHKIKHGDILTLGTLKVQIIFQE